MFEKFRIGDLPVDYNPKVHGPYDPARFYGKKDIPFGEVKLAELPSWIGRRNMGPRPFVALVSRGWWRYHHKYFLVKKGGIAPVIQLMVGLSVFFYAINYKTLQYHNNWKYHW